MLAYLYLASIFLIFSRISFVFSLNLLMLGHLITIQAPYLHLVLYILFIFSNILDILSIIILLSFSFLFYIQCSILYGRTSCDNYCYAANLENIKLNKKLRKRQIQNYKVRKLETHIAGKATMEKAIKLHCFSNFICFISGTVKLWNDDII